MNSPQSALSGREITRLMRRHSVSIRELASRLGVPMTRIRLAREAGVKGAAFVRDWLEAITGRDPGPIHTGNPVPPSSRAGRDAIDADDELSRAANLYERFSGHEAQVVGRVRVPGPLKKAIAIGDCDGILYSTIRDGKLERYIHRFRKADRPLLVVSPDGSQLALIGGNYTFTELGIVDHSDRKHWKGR